MSSASLLQKADSPDFLPRSRLTASSPKTSLSQNHRGKVVFVRGGKGVVKRLCELGLTPGTPVSMLRAAPLRGPVEIRVRGCDLALGRGIADKIFVEAEERAT